MQSYKTINADSKDFVGLPSDLWWLWPILSCFIFAFVVTLWIKRVPEFDKVIGVVTHHHGITATGRADIKILLPMRLIDQRPGVTVIADCSGDKFLGSVGPDPSQTIGKSRLTDLLGASKRVKSLIEQGVRVQAAEIETKSTLPAIGDLCQVTVEIGRVRLWRVLLGSYL